MILNVLNTIIIILPKKTGRKSQKVNNASNFEKQVAKRMIEAMIIDALQFEIINKHRDIEEEILDNSIQQSTKNASFAKVIRLSENGFTISSKKHQT